MKSSLKHSGVVFSVSDHTVLIFISDGLFKLEKITYKPTDKDQEINPGDYLSFLLHKQEVGSPDSIFTESLKVEILENHGLVNNEIGFVRKSILQKSKDKNNKAKIQEVTVHCDRKMQGLMLKLKHKLKYDENNELTNKLSPFDEIKFDVGYNSTEFNNVISGSNPVKIETDDHKKPFNKRACC